MSDLSRRSLLASVPAAALVTTPVAAVAAVAVATGADPVFAAIEAHSDAWAKFSALDDPSDDTYARQKGIVYTDADHAAFDAANTAEEEAWEELLSAPCETLAAVREKAAYLLKCSRVHDLPMQEEDVLPLLQSFAGKHNV
jgi:hypothetical protein